jgi:8-amino-7-oxononanoate synthase
MNQEFLNKRLEERKQHHAYRQLRLPDGKIDFCSNDYLGIVRNDLLSGPLTIDHRPLGVFKHGSTGSRLLAGNYALLGETEKIISAFHDAEAGLIFNSGYDANMGILGCVPQRGDTIIYDYLSHASIRDGIRLSFAQAFSFAHNDMESLEQKLKVAGGNIFVVTESVFSMDGDIAPLKEITSLCEKYNALLIVDEAHATGVIGEKGEGLVQHVNLQQKCFARIHTYGKAAGCHGAIVLGSENLRNYLINFSRPFIYTTALPETSVRAIRKAYEVFPLMTGERNHLQQLVSYFQSSTINFERLTSTTPIQGIVVPGNEHVKNLSWHLQSNNLDIRPILYPTVPKGGERLRIVLHAFNTMEEIQLLIENLHF